MGASCSVLFVVLVSPQAQLLFALLGPSLSLHKAHSCRKERDEGRPGQGQGSKLQFLLFPISRPNSVPRRSSLGRHFYPEGQTALLGSLTCYPPDIASPLALITYHFTLQLIGCLSCLSQWTVSSSIGSCVHPSLIPQGQMMPGIL